MNVGTNGAEKISVKTAILAGLPRQVLWRDLWNSSAVKAYAS